MKGEIKRDCIIMEFDLPVARALTCMAGLHDWRYWHMSPSFIAAFPGQANVCRDCVHCGWMESTKDGRKWRGRL